jgi:hypothetical protein
MEDTRYLSCTVHHLDGEAPWMRLAAYDGSTTQKPKFLVEQPLDSVDDATDLAMWVQMVLARACDVA